MRFAEFDAATDQPVVSMRVLRRGSVEADGVGGDGAVRSDQHGLDPDARAVNRYAESEHTFTIVIMRSLDSEDRTSKAIIRDEALGLFAARNVDAVTVRDIAAAAGVSPALVLRHYVSKDGLRAAVDEHVVRLFEEMLVRATATEGTAPFAERALPSLAEQIARYLPTDSPVPGYLTRLLVGGGPAATALFARLHALSLDTLAGLVEGGAAVDGGDPATRAAFLLANDLAVIMLRERLHEVLGVDPLSVDGLHRWGRQVLATYRGGLADPHSDQP